MAESRRERRAQERWRREMLRRLEELDRLDREHGLGTYPGDARHRLPGPAALPSEPVDLGRPQRRRRSVGPVIPGLLIALILTTLVMLRDPSATGIRFRQFVDHLTGNDGTYAFISETPTGRPIAWDPCEPIRYQVNPDSAPPGWEDTVEDAVNEAREASGFDFKYEGTTDERRFADRISGAATDPVLIGWADPGEVPELEGKTAGIGGASAQRTGQHIHFVTGIVVLDADAFGRMHVDGRLDAERLILAHELGHVLGLDHVEDSGELMNPEYVGQRGFGNGDKKGLSELHRQPCG